MFEGEQRAIDQQIREYLTTQGIPDPGDLIGMEFDPICRELGHFDPLFSVSCPEDPLW